MAYVPTETQMLFVRGDHDLAAFERMYRRAYEAQAKLNNAIVSGDVTKEHLTTDEGDKKRFTSIIETSSGLVIDIVDDHI